MQKLLGLIAASWMALSGLAHAGDRPVVVELFTSQGCSACPPADALLAQMADRDDVIPLALHIDYWDYIGWKDEFAKPAFTARQKGYAKAAKRRSVYTPQMVIDGQSDVVGHRAMQVVDLIAKHAAAPSRVDLTLTRDGSSVRIDAEATSWLGPVDVHVVRYQPSQEVAIQLGENAGKSLTYTHIVSSWEVHAQWDGTGRYADSVQVSGPEPVVILLQEPRHGAILAASRLR